MSARQANPVAQLVALIIAIPFTLALVLWRLLVNALEAYAQKTAPTLRRTRYVR